MGLVIGVPIAEKLEHHNAAAQEILVLLAVWRTNSSLRGLLPLLVAKRASTPVDLIDIKKAYTDDTESTSWPARRRSS